ncbi:hypothetical protein J4408_02980 [Candidatus Pacearchaeota archaeon]|nr:hypothetical protein [Candidatus Pacearchaeota archaeon]
MKFFSNKAIGFVITFFVLSILIIAGPAQSLVAGFTILNSVVDQGEKVRFQVSAEVEEGDQILDIQNFTLIFSGPELFSCIFDPDGDKISGCDEITINLTSKPDFGFEYGYGYGFLPGDFKFNLSLDTSDLDPGIYEVKLIVASPEKTLETAQKEITVLGIGTPVDICSIRARAGDAVIKNESFGRKNSASLYVGKNKAKKGEGSIINQKGRLRSTYSFDVNKAILIDANLIVFETTGKVKIDRLPEYTEKAKVIFNTNAMTLQVQGSTIKIEDMDVTFAKC